MSIFHGCSFRWRARFYTRYPMGALFVFTTPSTKLGVRATGATPIKLYEDGANLPIAPRPPKHWFADLSVLRESIQTSSRLLSNVTWRHPDTPHPQILCNKLQVEESTWQMIKRLAIALICGQKPHRERKRKWAKLRTLCKEA